MRLAEKLLQEANNATIETFLTILASKLTQYDKRMGSKRGYNPNAMGLYLEALEEVRKDMRGLEHKDDIDSIVKLIRSVTRHFMADFPPAANVVKQAKLWATAQVLPKLI